MSKIINPDDYAGNIVMTRIRLARNLKGYPFRVDNVSVAKDIVKKVNRALVRSDTFNLHYVIVWFVHYSSPFTIALYATCAASCEIVQPSL